MSLAKVGILSIGDMGMGVAKLLVANGFTVSTNVTGRSQETVDRAKAANITILDSDEELARHCDIILSVVPPRDAIETAQRIIDALPAAKRPADRLPLYYADMNAVAPSTCKAIASLFDTPKPDSKVPEGSGPESAIRLVDGCILGGPPQLRPAAAQPPVTTATTSSSAGTVSADASAPLEWYRPLMPTSGPHSLDVFPTLAETLNSRHISDEIGSASGLKMCFAAMSKGYSAIAIQAFTTAHRLGVLSDLQWAMNALVPGRVKQTEGALTGMAPKAYRWVREMEEISDTFSQEAGFAPDLFRGAAGVFKAVAEDTVLGKEKIGQRKRGRTAEDVAAAMAEGLEAQQAKKAKKQKTEESSGKPAV
ncbi:6-phosphogluconate dehydrogenase [Ophiostoma piceae UAMH 11346]|uniref:6-phosphogluconate dehydrogenase n=1 Tax=Ophiostoma piceae (strain UAMH 11346) TaxID=1262450 RepID=S3C0S5_OPHP1|nr:6-phosphogluconate dehydrogenase [Ophiostoma piceae UAMH 11346]